MAATLRRRREVMAEAIAAQGLTVAGHGAFGGSSFWMRAPEGVDIQTLAPRLKDRSVLIEPGHPFFADPARGSRHYRLGYSSIPSTRIPEGIARLAQTIAGLG
jgi:GntR family transcriptional regulator/MocR family aminotransferase